VASDLNAKKENDITEEITTLTFPWYIVFAEWQNAERCFEKKMEMLKEA
jgi:hypothetical protein